MAGSYGNPICETVGKYRFTRKATLKHKVMRKVWITAIALGYALLSFAGDKAKDYYKLIKKCDVVKEARWIELGSPAEFWNISINGNRQLEKFNKDIQKGKGAEKEALEAELKLPHFYPEYNEYVDRTLQGYCDSIVADMGLDKLGVNFTFNIINSEHPNVFSAPTEDGFAVCLTDGLFRNEKVTDEIVKGYVAHEFAHGALRHQLRYLYREAKKKRKDRVWGAVLVGATVTAVGAMECLLEDDTPVVYTVPLVSDKDGGSKRDGNVESAANKVLEDLNGNLKNNTLLYSFNFTPEQIYEADMMAFRFLQNIGAADAYVDGLKILGARYDSQFTTVPDHPTVSQRINFVKFVEENPNFTRDDD